MEESASSDFEDQLGLAQFFGGFVKLASCPADPWIDPEALKDTNRLREYQANRAARRRAAAFAGGMLAGIERLLVRRHGGPCGTDDSWIWFDAAAPFIVEIAEIIGRSAYVMGLRWVRQYLPGLGDEMGLMIALAHLQVDLEDRDEAVARQLATGGPLRWLPDMAKLRYYLRPTWEEVTGLNLRGWQAVDRPSDDELRSRKSDLQRDRRRRQGVRPRSTLTKKKVMEEIAVILDVSLSTVKRRRDEPVIAAMIRVMSEPTMTPRTDASTVPQVWLTPDAANDDAEITHATVSERAALAAVRRRCSSTPDLPECRKATEAVMIGRTTLAQRMRWHDAANDHTKAEAVVA